MNQHLKNIGSLERWTIENSVDLYGIRNWGGGYFDISEKGEITINPRGGDPANAFKIFPEVEEYFNASLQAKSVAVRKKKEAQAVWEKKNPALASKLAKFLSGNVPEIDYGQIVQKEKFLDCQLNLNHVLVKMHEKLKTLMIQKWRLLLK